MVAALAAGVVVVVMALAALERVGKVVRSVVRQQAMVVTVAVGLSTLDTQ